MKSDEGGEYNEYQQCLDWRFAGGHIGGLSSCIFCSEIYRRYHQEEIEKYQAEGTLNK